MKSNNKYLLMLSIIAAPNLVYALGCDGIITEVLSGNNYCAAGERVGFLWTGGSDFMCSSNKNMDALIIAAYAAGKTVSVRDSTWTSCTNHPAGTTPNHIWFKQ